MTFTLVSHLREQLSQLVRQKSEDEKRREAEKERLILEVCGSARLTQAPHPLQEEEKRTRGTPVTVEAFKVWKTKFDKEMAMKKAAEEEERLKNMTAKEREEWKRSQTRLSGNIHSFRD